MQSRLLPMCNEVHLATEKKYFLFEALYSDVCVCMTQLKLVFFLEIKGFYKDGDLILANFNDFI